MTRLPKDPTLRMYGIMAGVFVLAIVIIASETGQFGERPSPAADAADCPSHRRIIINALWTDIAAFAVRCPYYAYNKRQDRLAAQIIFGGAAIIILAVILQSIRKTARASQNNTLFQPTFRIPYPSDIALSDGRVVKMTALRPWSGRAAVLSGDTMEYLFADPGWERPIDLNEAAALEIVSLAMAEAKFTRADYPKTRDLLITIEDENRVVLFQYTHAVDPEADAQELALFSQGGAA